MPLRNIENDFGGTERVSIANTAPGTQSSLLNRIELNEIERNPKEGSIFKELSFSKVVI